QGCGGVLLFGERASFDHRKSRPCWRADPAGCSKGGRDPAREVGGGPAMSAAAFIARSAPLAVQLRLEGSPIFPSVRIAQSGLETGWKIPAWNNLGGYKVGSGKLTPCWRGKIVNKGTWEVYDGKRVDVTAAFRAYDSVEDFFRDQDLLFELPRYDRVRLATTPEEQADMLQKCGYATDPAYATKLKRI